MGRANKNSYEINPRICIIRTAKGDVIKVDTCDFHSYKLFEYSWYVSSRGYAITSKNDVKIYLHRLLMNPGTLQVDHINHDKLDNTRANLRVVSNRENHRNKLPNKRNTSGYSGVWWNKVCRKWCAQLRVDNVCVSSTLHETLEDAIAKRKELERVYWNI